MKVFISADIEGIAGVMLPEQCSPGHAAHELARSLMEQEVNAAIDGAFAGGATEVVVADSHAQMTNLRAENIDPRAQLVQGKPRPLSMADGIQGEHFDGLFFIGYHSGAGEEGILAHTINGRAFYRVTINGEQMAEADIYAAAGAENKTPVWLVSGDDRLQQWINRYYPSVHYVCVKRAISTTAAESLSPAAAHTAIRNAAYHVVCQASTAVTTRVEPPYKLELEVMKPILADLFCQVPGVKREGARLVTFISPSMTELVSLLSVFSYLASTQN